MKSWSDYFDKNGLLCQKSGDGGDTPSHEGLARLAASISPLIKYPSPLTLDGVLDLLMLSNGQLIRNPIGYANPNDTSRDQYRGIVISSVFQGKDAALQKMGKALPRNFIDWPVYTNGDIFTIEDKVMFNRDILRNAYCQPEQYLLALTADFITFLNTLTLCFWTTRKPNFISKLLGKLWWPFIAMNPPNTEGVQGSLRGPDYTSDDLGHIMLLIEGAVYRPTFLNKFSRFLYGKFRPNGIQWALDSYFAADDDPPVNELYRDILPRFFS